MIHKFLSVKLLIIISLTFSSIAFADTDTATNSQQNISQKEYATTIIKLKNQLKEKPKGAQLRYQLGNLYLLAGKTEAGVKELKRANRYAPEDIQILFRYIDGLQALNKSDQVINLLTTKLSETQQESLRLNYLAVAHLQKQDIAGARRLFVQSNILIKNPTAYNGLATLAIMEQDYTEAKELVDISFALDEKDTKTLQIQAKLANISQHPEEALKIYKQLITLKPNNITYYLERAATFAILKNNKLALEDLEVVLKRSPLQPQANYIKAQILLQKNDYKGAHEAAQNVVNVLPNNTQVTFILGAVNFALKNYNQAEEYLTIYTSNYPKNLKAQNLLANVYLAQNEPEQSLLILDTLPQHDLKTRPLLILTLTSSYLQINKIQKSIDILRQAIIDIPDNQELKIRLISIYFKNGNFDSAVNELEQLSANPSNQLKKEETNYLLIISYIKDKQLDKAEQKLKTLLTQTPDDKKLLNLQALIEQVRGNFKDAIRRYEKVLKQDKNDIPAQMGMARIYVLQEKLDKAKQYFQQVIAINPKEYKAYLGLVALSEKQGDSEKTEQYFLDALDESKGNSETTLLIAKLLGQWYQSKNQPKKILNLARNLAATNPDNEKIRFFLVRAQILNKKDHQAESTLKEITHADQQDIKNRILLAQLIAKDNNRLDESSKILEEAENIDSDSLAIYSAQNQLLIKKQEYYQALKLAKKIQEKYPESNAGILFEAQIYYLKKSYKKSLPLYQKIYKKTPNNKQLFSIIINLLIKMKDYDQAIQLLTKEAKKNPEDINNLFRLASLLQEREQFKKAEMYYQAVLKKNPKHIIALNNLAWIIIEKDQKEALNMAEKAYTLSPESASIIDTYGYFLALNKRYKQAFELLKIAIEKRPEDNDIQYHLAFLYHKMGQNKEALNILKKIITTDNNFHEKDKAQQLYDTLK